MKRLFSKRQRRLIYFLCGGCCTLCNKELNKNFHADHKFPFSKGGKTLINNAQALCATCNKIKGDKVYD